MRIMTLFFECIFFSGRSFVLFVLHSPIVLQDFCRLFFSFLVAILSAATFVYCFFFCFVHCSCWLWWKFISKECMRCSLQRLLSTILSQQFFLFLPLSSSFFMHHYALVVIRLLRFAHNTRSRVCLTFIRKLEILYEKLDIIIMKNEFQKLKCVTSMGGKSHFSDEEQSNLHLFE